MRLEGVIYRDEAQVRRYIASGSWSDLTLGDALRRSAARLPDRLAYGSEEGRLSFRELDERSDRLAGALLLQGVKPGERAIFQMGTVLETAIALCACFKAGILPVCTVPQYREIEIGQLTELSGATLYFVQADFGAFDLVAFAQGMRAKFPALKRLIVARAKSGGDFLDFHQLIETTALAAARAALFGVKLDSRDCAMFQLSGGSTGVPKIIPRFHGEYLAGGPHWVAMQGMDEHSVAIWSLPLIHNAGMYYAFTPTILWGRTTILVGKTDVALLLGMIERYRATHAASIGPIAAFLLNYPDIRKHDLSTLKYFITMARADAVEAHLGVPCANLYGITEGLVMVSPPDALAAARHGTQGRAVRADDEVKVIKVGTEEPAAPGELGELVFRGPSSLLGYYNAPQQTRETLTSDGFVRTSDLVKAHVIDGVTYYSFEGRLKDNINRGGEKYGTEEVEKLIREHPAVADVAVVAMPDKIFFEKGCAYIIPKRNMALPSVKDLGAFLTAKGLAKFKLPERIEAIDAFPVTRVGKLDKARLRAIITERLRQEEC
jgi:non-ribosomal peptide synthetase component E (peptide arylation enzyme)